MKRLSAEQLQNMVFVVAVVVACAVIGMLVGRSERKAAPSDASAAPSPTEDARAAATATPAFGTTRSDVLFAFISEGYSISETSANGADFIIKDVPEIGTVYLNSSKENKRIVALSMRIPLYQPTVSPTESAIERALAIDASDGVSETYRMALTRLLSVLCAALLLEADPSGTVLNEWTDAVLAAMATGKSATCREDFAVLTIAPQYAAEQMLVCTLAASA